MSEPKNATSRQRHSALSSTSRLESIREHGVLKRDPKVSSRQPPISRAPSSIYSQPSGYHAASGSTRGSQQSVRRVKQEAIKGPSSSRSATSVIPAKASSELEQPTRLLSFRPSEKSLKERTINDREAKVLCDKLCSRVWRTDLGGMWDNAVAADKKGNVNDKLYSQLLDFFYCYLPVSLL
jgi:hypothetical protein